MRARCSKGARSSLVADTSSPLAPFSSLLPSAQNLAPERVDTKNTRKIHTSQREATQVFPSDVRVIAVAIVIVAVETIL